MTDTKKSDTASEENERSEEDIVDKAQGADEAADEGGSLNVDDKSAQDEIEDAEIVEDLAADDSAAEAPETRDESGTPSQGMEAEELTEPEDEAEIADLEAMDGVASTQSEGDEISPEAVEPQTKPEPARMIEKETVVVERKGAVVPGFLGGALAAAGLLFAAPFVIPAKFFPVSPEIQETLATQDTTIAELQSEIEALEGQLADTASSGALAALKTESDAAMAAMTSAVAEARSRIEALTEDIASGDALGDLPSQLDTLKERLGTLEKRPLEDAPDPASIAAVEAYGRELAALRDTIAAQMTEADDLVKSAAAAAEKAVREALEASNNAMEDAEATERLAQEKARRAAQAQSLVSIQAALDEGASYSESLSELEGVEIPDALATAAEDGVPTLPELQAAFTLAARKALTVSRNELSDGSTVDRASTWLQNQLGIRSLAPSEGDDPDAVLSRAEAALAEARIEDAISELSALPEGGQELMAEWVALATARAEALAAANVLAASLAAN